MMKLLVVFALALATASAGFVAPNTLPVHPRDLTVSGAAATPEGRITNGKVAAEGEFPYQVGLSFSGKNGGWWCGGSVISSTWVLTAAHCTSGADKVEISLGATDRTKPQVKHIVLSKEFRQHEKYNSILLRNDISLIQMPAVAFTSRIKKIDLPKIASSYSNYNGDVATASGWGLERDGASSVASRLNYADLKVISNADCAKTYGSLTITDKNICTATPDGTSTCSGDSGGPLALRKDNLIIGVTSFVSSAGCQSGAPAGFVRVTGYLDWIKDHTNISY